MKKYIGLEGMPSCDASVGDMQKFERKRSMRYKVHMYPITELECMTVRRRHSSPAAHTPASSGAHSWPIHVSTENSRFW